MLLRPRQLFLLFSLLPFLIPLSAFAQTSGQEDVSISALVPAAPSDYPLTLTETSQSGAHVRPNTGMDFTITYGSTLSYATAITVEAEWSLGTGSGDTVPTVPIVRYKNNASNGYNYTVPVVDLVGRKITWTIPNFPGDTESSVTFSLETVDTYTLTTPVGFSVSARLIGPGTLTPDKTISKTYRNIPDTNTSTAAGPSATPTLPPPTFSLDQVGIQTIATDSASILVTTSLPSTLRVSYGLAPRLLTKHLSFPQAVSHLIRIPSMQPGKTYFFQVVATDVNGRVITTSMYSLTTASAPPEEVFKTDTILLRASDITLHFPGSEISPEEIVAVIPIGTPLTLQTRQPKPDRLQSIILELRNLSVLGTNTAMEETASSNGMVALQPDVFSGTLNALQPGIFLILARVKDSNGNLSEYALTRIRAVQPLTVLSANSKEPVERAKISLSKYDPVTRLHTLIPAQSGIINPAVTDAFGKAAIVLPKGQYRITVTAIGYEEKTVDFTIGNKTGDVYPTVLLTQEPFSFFTVIHFVSDASIELYTRLEGFAQSLALSSRYFTIGAAVVIGCFVLLTLLAFTARTHIPLYLIAGFIVHHLLMSRSKHAVIRGTIYDFTTKKPIRQVRVALIDAGNGKIQTQTKTDKNGNFLLRILTDHGYRISMIKTGYQPLEQVVHASADPIVISLQQSSGASFLHIIMHSVRLFLSVLFEMLLIGSIVLEFAFASAHGIFSVLPFLILSFFNAFLWVFYVYHEKWKHA